MSRDLEEKIIAKSFQELKREDEAAAPSFDLLLERVSFEQSAPRRRYVAFSPIYRIAAIALIVAGGLLTFYFSRSEKEPVGIDAEQTAAKPQSNSSQLLSAGDAESAVEKAYERAPKSRRASDRAKRPRLKRRGNIEKIAFSSWRPPTDFLLRSSVEELFKSIPRLGESLTEVEFGSVEEN